MIAFAAALLIAAFAPGQPPSGPYVLLRADGTEIRLMEPPRRKGELLIGRLWPEGTLVSFPSREVDSRRTEGANAAGVPVPTRTPPAPSLGDVVARAGRPTPVPLGDRVKLTRSRGEVERELQKSSGTGRREEPDAEAEAKRPRRPRVAAPEHVDLQGRGEEWWRARADRIHDEIESSKRELAAAEAEAERFERDWMPAGGIERSSWAWELQQRRDAILRARAHVSDAESRMRLLQDEARKADAYPGWLR